MRSFPWLLAVSSFAICGLSFLFIRSAAFDAATGGFEPYAERQAAWLLVSAAVFLGLAFVPYDKLTKHGAAIYVASLMTLLAVPILGASAHGAKRWFAIGSVRVQPSEFGKYAVLLLLARVIAREGEAVRTWRGLAKPAALTLVPFLLIAKQPDLGTALTYVPILGACLFAAGARVRHFATVGAVVAAILPIAWFFLLHDYQKDRVITFISPEKSSLGGAYQALQSQIAVGAGGLVGKGFEQGTQGSLGFLPFRHTDFIFAVVGEEWGFVGGLLLLALYAVVLYALGEIALETRDLEGRLVVVGVATILLTQVVVNIAMATGIAPVVGITLPLVSYGGSSLLANLGGLGLAASVAMRKPVIWTRKSEVDPTTVLANLEVAPLVT